MVAKKLRFLFLPWALADIWWWVSLPVRQFNMKPVTGVVCKSLEGLRSILISDRLMGGENSYVVRVVM